MTSGSEIEGHAVIGVADYVRFAIGSPRQLIFECTAISLIVATSVFFSRGGLNGMEPASYLGLVVLIAFSVFVFGNLLFGGYAVLRVLRYTHAQKSLYYRIDRTGITIKSDAGSESKVPWTVIRNLKRRGDGILVLVKPFGKAWLPARAFDGAAFASITELAASAGVLLN